MPYICCIFNTVVVVACVIFIPGLKNVSCEYDRVNGWNSTLQATRVPGNKFIKVGKRQLWVRPCEWLKLKFASCVVHQTRSYFFVKLGTRKWNRQTGQNQARTGKSQGRGSEATETVFCLQAKKPLHSGSYEHRVPKIKNKKKIIAVAKTSDSW